MIAKVSENSYFDIDAITAITGVYTHKNPDKWITHVVMGSAHGTYTGAEGKNIMEAFLWKHKHAVYDMMPGSDSYRKQIRGEKT